MLFLDCFSFNHVYLACQAEAWPDKFSYLLSLPLHPTGRVYNVLHGATSRNMGLSPLHLKEIGNPGYPSWITALISLVYHKKWHKHSYQAALKRQEYSPLGQLCGKEKYF